MKNKKNDDPALEKSFSFALRTVKLYPHLSDWKKKFMNASKSITDKQFDSIYSDCSELIRIFASTQLTMRRELQKGN